MVRQLHSCERFGESGRSDRLGLPVFCLDDHTLDARTASGVLENSIEGQIAATIGCACLGWPLNVLVFRIVAQQVVEKMLKAVVG